MTDDRWVSALRGMDGPVDPDPTFADALFESLVRDLRGRRSAPSLTLIAAVVALTVLLAGAIVVGSGLLRPNVDEDLLRTDVPVVPVAAADEWGFGPYRPQYRESWCEGHDADVAYPREVEGDSLRRTTECSFPDGGSASFEDRIIDGSAFLVRSELIVVTNDGGRRRAERWLASFEDGYADAVSWLRGQLDDLGAMSRTPKTDVSRAANGTTVLAGAAADVDGGEGGMARLWVTTEVELYPAVGCFLTLWQYQSRPELHDGRRMVGLSPALEGAPIVVPLASRDQSGQPIAHVVISGEGWGPGVRFELSSDARGDGTEWESGVEGQEVTMAEPGLYRLEVDSRTTECRASIPIVVVDDEDR